MFDIIQVSWWLFQVSIIGFFITNSLGKNLKNKILISPVVGLAVLLVFGNFLWMWSLSTLIMTYLWVTGIFLILFYLIRTRHFTTINFIHQLKSQSWLAIGSIILILHGSLLPFSEKLFQAFPLDRLFYLGASILFQQENISYFTDALARLVFNGDKRVFMTHSLLPMALNEMKARPATEIAFVILTWATPRDLYRLGNAWEVFLRTLQYIGVYSIFITTLGLRAISGILALMAVFGYWFQYVKDFNAWASMTCLTLAITTIACILNISEQEEIKNKDRYLAYLLIFASILSYPELGLPLSLVVMFLLTITKKFRILILSKKIVYLELLVLIGSVFIVHPYILDFIKRQIYLSPFMAGGEFSQASGIYHLLGTAEEKIFFINKIIANPWNLFKSLNSYSDLIIGTFGFPYVQHLRGPQTLIISFILIFGFFSFEIYEKVKNKYAILKKIKYLILTLFLFSFIAFYIVIKRKFGLKDGPAYLNNFTSLILGSFLVFLFFKAFFEKQNKKLNILLSIIGAYLFIFLTLLMLGMIGGSYRSLPFLGCFSSLTFLLLLAQSNKISFKFLSVLFSMAHLIFGISIFYVTNHKGMDSYPTFYTLSNGIRHFEVPKVKEKYNFDYTDLISQLSLCHSVYLDLPKDLTYGERVARFQSIFLVMFLENNKIPYYLSMPYRNASPLLGDPYHPGFKKEEIYADCIVEEEIKDGLISYKFVQNKWY